ncbi:DMT family transporter [Mycolicibacter sp. MYC123]|uniref:DMT family transporter n=1 Tax=[Mycobacterium] zoologicum TaxID=2872311 RepID=A0ABU5YNJ1_9MYCO|nr:MULTISPECIES: DMT family transporter [unclassified Mycolicibacter]MEB3051633.1 DMT family transporter [Mycolicibacter sp. MYC123]MEB3064560.1 DMT family transporter [Mycolicibacter sp. MYC101]
MSTGNLIAALLALCAALASAIGDVIRQRSAQEITDQQVGHLRLFWLSLRDPRWWGGGAAAVANYALQAAALAVGSVMLVTGLQVTALLFALPMYAWLTHRRVSNWEWMWAIVLAGALAVVVIVGDPTEGKQHAPATTWIVVSVVLTAVLLSCVLFARKFKGRPAAAVLLAVVAGASLAVFALLTKVLVELVKAEGLEDALESPVVVPWLVATLAGMIFQQSAFRAGALTASMPTMTVAKPLVASVLGVLLLNEHINAGGIEDVAVIIGVVLIVIATAALARGEAATIVADAGGADRGTPVPSVTS